MEKIPIEGGETLYFRPFVADSPPETQKMPLSAMMLTTALLLHMGNVLTHFQESYCKL
jgi:hypothetical protein